MVVKLKKSFLVFMAAFIVLGSAPKAFCYEADVTDISGSKYFPAVKEALLKAEESISLVMFIIELSQYRENSKVNQLVDELVEAKKRGVDIEIILDQNIDFVGIRHKSESQAKIRSLRAYKFLKAVGVKVYYDEPAKYTHAKAIVIDKRIVILGSTNWTKAALERSIEVSALVKSTISGTRT